MAALMGCLRAAVWGLKKAALMVVPKETHLVVSMEDCWVVWKELLKADSRDVQWVADLV